MQDLNEQFSRNFISSQLLMCAANPNGKMMLGTKSHRCDGNPYSLARDFYDYFNGEGGFKNPYEIGKVAVKVAANPLLKGETAIIGVIANPSYISIKTKIEDGSGGSYLLSDIAIKEQWSQNNDWEKTKEFEKIVKNRCFGNYKKLINTLEWLDDKNLNMDIAEKIIFAEFKKYTLQYN